MMIKIFWPWRRHLGTVGFGHRALTWHSWRLLCWTALPGSSYWTGICPGKGTRKCPVEEENNSPWKPLCVYNFFEFIRDNVIKLN